MAPCKLINVKRIRNPYQMLGDRVKQQSPHIDKGSDSIGDLEQIGYTVAIAP